MIQNPSSLARIKGGLRYDVLQGSWHRPNGSASGGGYLVAIQRACVCGRPYFERKRWLLLGWLGVSTWYMIPSPIPVARLRARNPGAISGRLDDPCVIVDVDRGRSRGLLSATDPRPSASLGL